MAMLARIPMIPTTIINSTIVNPRGGRRIALIGCDFELRIARRATSLIAHPHLLLARRDQVAGQYRAAPELFRDRVERPVQALALLPAGVEQAELRGRAAEVSGVHTREAD